MSLQFPNRFVWFCIGLVLIVLLQSGCALIPPPTAAQPTPPAAEDDSAVFIENTSTQTTSPNGEWIATTVFQVPEKSQEYYQSLVVAHASGAPSYTLVKGWFAWLPGYKVAEPLMWSQDGQRFYYTNRIQADGCGLLFNGSDLYQVELATGETVELLPPDTTTKLGLAPDEQHVAYLDIGNPAMLILHDLASGEKTPFDLTATLGNDQMGAIVWSPDSSALAFVVAHSPCMGGWAESTSVYVLDTEAMTLTSHLQMDDRLLMPVAWPDESTLLLENQTGETFTLDMTTATVIP